MKNLKTFLVVPALLALAGCSGIQRWIDSRRG